MANLEKTVEIIFSGTDSVSKTMMTVTGSLDRFASKTQSVTQPLADVAAGVLKTEGALAALAAGGLAYAYAKSIEFEGAAIDLKKVMGENAEGFDTARQGALELSNEFGVSAVEVLSSTANFKQAGFNIEEAMLLAEAALKLVSASELNAAESSDILIRSLKGFGAPASEAERLMDILNHTSSLYATNVGELATGMAVLSPLAAQMGYSFEEMSGLLTPIIEVFGSGSEAANALKIGLLNLGTETKPVAQALEILEVAQRDHSGELRSTKDIMADVQKAFGSLTDTQKTNVTQLLAGKNQAARMAIAYDGLALSAEIVEENLKNAAGSINNEVALALSSGEVAVKRFKEGFVNMAIAVGERFQDSATGAIEGATEIEITLMKLADSAAFDELLGVVGGMSDDIGALFEGIAKAMPEAMDKVNWDGFTRSLQGVLDEVGDLFDAMFGGVDLTTPEGVAKVMQKIIDAGAALNNVVAGILDVWEPFILGLSEGIDKFAKGGPEVQKFAGEVVGWGQAINTTMKFVGPLTSALSSLSGALYAIAGVQAGKMFLSFGKGAAAALADVKGLPNAINAVIGTAGGKAGLLGLAGAAGWTAGTIINENVPAVGKAAQSMFEWSDKILNWTGTQKSANQTLEEEEAYLKAVETALERTKSATDALDGSKADVDVTADTSSFESNLAKVNASMAEWEYEEAIKTLTIDNREALDKLQETQDGLEVMGMDPDAFKGIEDFLGQIDEELKDNKVDLGIDVDDKDLDKAKDKIKKAFSKAEMGPVGLDFDVGSGVGGIYDQVTSQFKDKKIPMENLFDPSGLSDLFEALDSADSMRARAQIERAINQQLNIQRELANIEKANTQRMWEAAYMMKSTSEMVEAGGTIKIDAQGLEPEMEAFMWKLLKKIQVRANKSGAEFLLAAT